MQVLEQCTQRQSSVGLDVWGFFSKHFLNASSLSRHVIVSLLNCAARKQRWNENTDKDKVLGKER